MSQYRLIVSLFRLGEGNLSGPPVAVLSGSHRPGVITQPRHAYVWSPCWLVEPDSPLDDPSMVPGQSPQVDEADGELRRTVRSIRFFTDPWAWKWLTGPSH